MRLISQDGKLDVPYERCNVCLRITDENEIICYDTGNVGFSPWLLGKYSTEENAKKAMKLLKMEFIEYGDSGYFEFPQDEEV